MLGPAALEFTQRYGSTGKATCYNLEIREGFSEEETALNIGELCMDRAEHAIPAF